MPDLIRLRWLGYDDTMVPVLGRMVGKDETVDLAGRIVVTVDENEPPLPEDGYLIEFGNPPQRRVFPNSQWSVEAPAKKTAKE